MDRARIKQRLEYWENQLDKLMEAYTKLIEGEVGTNVVLRVRKGKTGNEQTYTVTRAKLDEITVESEMLDNHIGYIRIKKFRTVSVAQFRNAMNTLHEKGAEKFIFDVRDNGGGVLSALEQMVDPLLPEGELAFAHDKQGNATTILTSDAEQMEFPMAILVNGNTASASELFACVLRDYAGAKLVGEKTFGKGIMQTTFPLSSGAVTLTTATYETGITPCYHGVGLEPDVLSVPAEDTDEDTCRSYIRREIRRARGLSHIGTAGHAEPECGQIRGDSHISDKE